MKNSKTTKQIVIIVFTFLVMAFCVYAVFSGKILTQDEASRNIERGMIEKLK